MQSTKRGSVTVKIWETHNGPYTRFAVNWYERGQRKQRKFSDRDKADAFAKAMASRLASGEIHEMTADEVGVWRQINQITPNPMAALNEWANLRKRLPNVTVEALVECWERHHAAVVEASPAEIAAKMIEEKKQMGLSAVYIRDLKTRCAVFAAAFARPISTVRHADVSEWLSKRKLSPRSRNNYLGAVQTLCAWAKDHKHLPSDWDEIDRVPRAKMIPGDIEIFTPDEMRKLLAASKGPDRAYLALAAFSGVRQAELLRLDWSDIKDGHIEITAGKAKTAQRRLVPIAPNLAAWLATMTEKKGRIYPYTVNNSYARLERRAQWAGIAWKHNALRHSYVSYRVAQTQNVDQVSMESGNSPRMIHRNYRELVTAKQAEEWFAIVPNSCPQILNLTKPL